MSTTGVYYLDKIGQIRVIHNNLVQGLVGKRCFGCHFYTLFLVTTRSTGKHKTEQHGSGQNFMSKNFIHIMYMFYCL